MAVAAVNDVPSFRGSDPAAQTPEGRERRSTGTRREVGRRPNADQASAPPITNGTTHVHQRRPDRCR